MNKELNEMVETSLDKLLKEKISKTEISRQLHAVPPGPMERAWVPGEKKATGTKKEVTLEVPVKDDIKDSWVFHTHPGGEPPIPSFQDLISAIKSNIVLGAKGSAIISGHYYTAIEPTDKIISKVGKIERDDKGMDDKIASKISGAKSALEKPSKREIIDALRDFGFDIDTNHEKEE